VHLAADALAACTKVHLGSLLSLEQPAQIQTDIFRTLNSYTSSNFLGILRYLAFLGGNNAWLNE